MKLVFILGLKTGVAELDMDLLAVIDLGSKCPESFNFAICVHAILFLHLFVYLFETVFQIFIFEAGTQELFIVLGLLILPGEVRTEVWRSNHYVVF